MKKYTVSGVVTISVHTDVEARSPSEAKRIACGRGMVALCARCAEGEPSEEWVTSGELDGEPDRLEVEEPEE